MATIKQRRAFKQIMENHGNVSRSMSIVGYKDATSKNPKNLTNSKGWKELLEEYIPEEDLLKVHKEGLKASKEIVVDGKKVAGLEIPDYAVRHKYLETGYKVRNKLSNEEPKGDTFNTVIFQGSQAERVARRILARRKPSAEGLDRLPDSNES